jgi:hypothetical protein
MVQTRFNRGWCRRGFGLLWDVEALAQVADPDAVLSLRQFFAHADHWPDGDLPAADGYAMVVSGLEGCLDILARRDAELWIETDLKEAILSFQDFYQGGAGLIFWLPSGRNRISMKGATEQYYWKHRDSGPDGLPIGRLLFSGAESEVERIMNTDDTNADYDGKHWVGLHHPRIS